MKLRRPARDFCRHPPKAEDPTALDHPNTTHYSVVDTDGNAVSVTTTLNNSFGSAVTAEGLGFLLNDEMDDFAAKQGVPNLYGLIQGPANAIAPGKRPLSSMTPTIVVKDGKLRMVLGSPGGARIITTVANIFLSAAAENLNIQQAGGCSSLPPSISAGRAVSGAWVFLKPTTAGLQALGYKLDDERALMERWGMHRRQSQDRLAGGQGRIIATIMGRPPASSGARRTGSKRLAVIRGHFGSGRRYSALF